MPLYEFECTRCSERFEEILRNLEQAAEVTCPECGCEDVERLQSGFATIGGSGGEGVSPAHSCSGRGGFS